MKESDIYRLGNDPRLRDPRIAYGDFAEEERDIDLRAVLGFLSAEIVRAGPKLRWVHADDLLGGGGWSVVVTSTVPITRSGGADAAERRWRLWRENVRRFVAGEPLLCVVVK